MGNRYMKSIADGIELTVVNSDYGLARAAPKDLDVLPCELPRNSLGDRFLRRPSARDLDRGLAKITLFRCQNSDDEPRVLHRRFDTLYLDKINSNSGYHRVSLTLRNPEPGFCVLKLRCAILYPLSFGSV